MKINRNNYEIWFLDFYEGRLTEEQVDELMIFLEQHYDLKEEFNNFENISLPSLNNVVFDEKDSLKKSVIICEGNINENNYIDYFIREVEGDLTNEEAIALDKFIKINTFLKKELELFKKTKIFPDQTITFPLKENIKKKEIVPVGFINEKNYTEIFIAAIENDLSHNQHNDLKEFLITNTHLKKEFELFGQTKLMADTTIVFNNKNQLKKKANGPKIVYLKNLYYPISVAASVIFVIAIYSLLKNETSNSLQISYRNSNINKRIFVENSILKNHSPSIEINTKNKQEIFEKMNENNDIVLSSAFIEYKGIQNVLPLKSKLIINNNKKEQNNIKARTIIYDDLATKTNRDVIEKDLEEENEFISLKDFALFKIKKSIAPKDKKDEITVENNKISFWDFADAGFDKLNNLAGVEAKLKRDKETGEFTFALGNKFEILKKTNTEKNK